MKTFLIFIAFGFLPSLVFGQTVFTVAGKKISAKEFKERYEFVRKNSVNPPSKDQFVQDWIKFEMGVKEAYSKNLNKSPEVIQAMEQVLYNALLEKEVGDRIQNIRVKESEMKAYYRNNPSVRTRHILISLKEEKNKLISFLPRRIGKEEKPLSEKSLRISSMYRKGLP